MIQRCVKNLDPNPRVQHRTLRLHPNSALRGRDLIIVDQEANTIEDRKEKRQTFVSQDSIAGEIQAVKEHGPEQSIAIPLE